jgi:hypothetical protein
MFARQFLQVFQLAIVADLFSFPVIYGVHNAEDGNNNAGKADPYGRVVHMLAVRPCEPIPQIP